MEKTPQDHTKQMKVNIVSLYWTTLARVIPNRILVRFPAYHLSQDRIVQYPEFFVIQDILKISINLPNEFLYNHNAKLVGQADMILIQVR